MGFLWGTVLRRGKELKDVWRRVEEKKIKRKKRTDVERTRGTWESKERCAQLIRAHYTHSLHCNSPGEITRGKVVKEAHQGEKRLWEVHGWACRAQLLEKASCRVHKFMSITQVLCWANHLGECPCALFYPMTPLTPYRDPEHLFT